MPTPLTISYGHHDGRSLDADVYVPTDAAGAPVCICVHGGAWQRGSRASYRYVGPALARAGYVAMSIDYRLVTGTLNRHPAAANDVRAAIAYAEAHALEWGGDPQRIVMIGDSAGGHLASLVALTSGARVKALVSVYGIYDLVAHWEWDLSDQLGDANIVQAFLGMPLVADRRPYFEASPLTYAVTANNALPVLLGWGTNDDIVEPAQSERFLRALKLAGFYVRTVVQAAPHYWLSDPLDEPGSYSGFFTFRMLRFLADRVPPRI